LCSNDSAFGGSSLSSSLASLLSTCAVLPVLPNPILKGLFGIKLNCGFANCCWSGAEVWDDRAPTLAWDENELWDGVP